MKKMQRESNIQYVGYDVQVVVEVVVVVVRLDLIDQSVPRIVGIVLGNKSMPRFTAWFWMS